MNATSDHLSRPPDGQVAVSIAGCMDLSCLWLDCVGWCTNQMGNRTRPDGAALSGAPATSESCGEVFNVWEVENLMRWMK